MAELHFIITGDFVTRTARDLVLEGRPDHAFRMLLCVGDGSCATPVLSGDKRLTGDSDKGVTLEDEDQNEKDTYKKRLAWTYAGRIRLQGRWYRPKAFVSGGNEDDARYAMARTGRGVPTMLDHMGMSAWARERVDYYTERDEIIVELDSPTQLGEVFVQCGAHIIFEPCGEPPAWRRPALTPAAALAEFRASGRKLEERGPTFAKRAPHRQAEGGAEADAEERERIQIQRREEVAREEEEREAAEWAAKLQQYQKEILTLAGDDLFTLTWDDKAVKVPRIPFVCYALTRTALRHLAPPWKPVCPSGLKMSMDNPFHTDWMVGAGLFDFTAYYRDEALQHAVYAEVARLQEQHGSFKCAVLNDAGEASGSIGDEILVLPNLDPRYLESMVTAKGVITETGGAAAHLVQVARDQGLTIVRVPDARKKYIPGTRATITPSEGRVRVFTYYGDDGKPFVP